MRRAATTWVLALAIVLPACSRSSDGGQPATVQLSSRVAAEIPVAGGPDWLAATDRGLWVKRDDGVVSLVDTTSNKVVDDVTIGGDDYCQGVGADDTSLWVCSARDVVRHDIASKRLVSRWTGHKVNDQGELSPINGRVWVGSGDARTLSGIDTKGVAADVQFHLPVRVTDVGSCVDQLWVVSEGEGRVLRLDPGTGAVKASAALDGARALSCNGDVWAVGSTAAIRLDPTSGRVLASVPVQHGVSIAVGAHSVWVRATAPFLLRIDRATGVAKERFVSTKVASAGDITIADGSVWTATSEEGILFRLSGDT